MKRFSEDKKRIVGRCLKCGGLSIGGACLTCESDLYLSFCNDAALENKADEILEFVLQNSTEKTEKPKKYTCRECGNQIENKDWCPYCVDRLIDIVIDKLVEAEKKEEMQKKNL